MSLKIKCFFSLVCFLFCTCILLASFTYKVQSIPTGYMRISFNDGIICLVRSKPASVLVFDQSGQFLSEITFNLSYPVSAVHVAGMIYVSDYYRSSVMVYTIFGAFLKRIEVGKYPTMVKVFRENVYVVCSGDSTVYRINIWKNVVEEKLTFDSPTLYFEPFQDEVVYLYYYDTGKTLEIRQGLRRKVVNLQNLKNPVKYYRGDEGEYLLGYTDGILVKLNEGKEVWRVNLPDFARDFVVLNDSLVVTSLFEPVLSFVSTRDGKLIKQIKLPNPTHKILSVADKLVTLNHLPGEVYIVDPTTGNFETIKVGEYAIEMVKINDQTFVVLCCDSGELFFFVKS
ncbi:hypothetical protein [Pseudothermotoga thermarum]|uniref:Uncharacterized protein n=1 Tax=Pseudothermotoga thermarum DSM 5069 TaxID=688269 RepID=F7YW87_9THEM|nr:hypothetical protein [Pseudothermotoga thermarum]AEH51859.1 hypothetical protein Theth_1817 [Pseudothermotoga thermarum DSM 5069]